MKRVLGTCWGIVAALAACGGNNKVRPDGGGGGSIDGAVDGAPDAALDAAPDAAPDAPPGPPLTVLVSKDGSDLHDGITMPVETLKRALQIANANPRISDIAIGFGDYTMRSGETFPYQVPPNIVIRGQARLVGTGAETGLQFTDGQVQGVGFDNFKVAIEATGSLRIKDLKILDSATGVHGTRTAKLRIDNLEITAVADGSCPTGIELEGELFATHLTTTFLGAALHADNAVAVDIAMSRLSGLAGVCHGPTVDVVNGGQSFAISDTRIENSDVAIRLAGAPDQSPDAAHATLTNNTFVASFSGVQATGMSVQITGGSFEVITFIGFEGHAGNFSFDGVGLNGNDGAVVVAGTAATPATLRMRRSSLASSNGTGIVVSDHATADLGTTASPGQNSLVLSVDVGLNLRGAAGQNEVTAVGNVWRGRTQGSDDDGHYASQLIRGPIPVVPRNNFALSDGWSLQL